MFEDLLASTDLLKGLGQLWPFVGKHRPPGGSGPAVAMHGLLSTRNCHVTVQIWSLTSHHKGCVNITPNPGKGKFVFTNFYDSHFFAITKLRTT